MKKMLFFVLFFTLIPVNHAYSDLSSYTSIYGGYTIQSLSYKYDDGTVLDGTNMSFSGKLELSLVISAKMIVLNGKSYPEFIHFIFLENNLLEIEDFSGNKAIGSFSFNNGKLELKYYVDYYDPAFQVNEVWSQDYVMYTEEKCNQALSNLNATKNQEIVNLNQIISNQNQTITNMYTETELNASIANATEDMIGKNKIQFFIKNATLEERKRWDVNNDNSTGIPEAIHALQVTSDIN